ncbi:MAG: hypothetical protein ACRCZ3_10700 [Providencia rustigianii]|uniref:phage tail fiber protein n=1 Tax=Providencia rustigianii TaxID=158850 RepID=UPI003F2A4BEA
MKQTGKIFTWKNDDKGAPQENPLKNTFFYFKQGNIRKATMQTSEKGEFSFDLPLGSYTIQISQGASFEILDLFAGVPFELLSTSSEKAFNDWFMNPVTVNPNENPLVVRLQQLAKIATDAATEAQQIQQQMQNNSIGDANGKWVKEGGYGLGSLKSVLVNEGGIVDNLMNKPNGFYRFIGNIGLSQNASAIVVHSNDAGEYTSGAIAFDMFRDRVSGAMKRNSTTPTTQFDFYTTLNVTKDNNGVMHNTTKVPKDTLLVGDLGLGGYNVSTPEKINQFHDGLMFMGDPSSANSPFSRTGTLLHMGAYAGMYAQLHIANNNKVKFRIGNKTTALWGDQYEFWTTANTIVDTNGNVKRASPTIELFNDHINFTGFGDQVPIFEKLATGTYKISNTHGMAREGWTYQKPQGKDGNYFFKIRVQKLDDGCIVTVHDYYTADEEVEIIDEHGKPRKVKKQVEVLGMPRDIKASERWINLRFHEQIYSLTNELPELNVPYREL